MKLAAAQAAAQAEIVEKGRFASRFARARACYNEMNPENQELTKARFADFLAEKERGAELKSFNKDGVDATKRVAGTFDNWLADEKDKGAFEAM